MDVFADIDIELLEAQVFDVLSGNMADRQHFGDTNNADFSAFIEQFNSGPDLFSDDYTLPSPEPAQPPIPDPSQDWRPPIENELIDILGSFLAEPVFSGIEAVFMPHLAAEGSNHSPESDPSNETSGIDLGDLNKDIAVFQKSEDDFNTLDTNGDGVISYTEAMAESGLPDALEDLDVDGSGDLSFEEFEDWEGDDVTVTVTGGFNFPDFSFFDYSGLQDIIDGLDDVWDFDFEPVDEIIVTGQTQTPPPPPTTDVIIVTEQIQTPPPLPEPYIAPFPYWILDWNIELDLDFDLPEIETCGLLVTPDQSGVDSSGLSETHASMLSSLLSAIGDSQASSILASIPPQYHAHEETVLFSLADLTNVLADVSLSSGNIPQSSTSDARVRGTYNPNTNTILIDNDESVDYEDFVQTVLHEALHAYIYGDSSLAYVIDHGQFGVTSQNHQGWFDTLVNSLIAQLEAAVGNLEHNVVNCS